MSPHDPPPAPRATPPVPPQQEDLRDAQAQVEGEGLGGLFDIEALRQRIANGPAWKAKPCARDHASVSMSDAYRRLPGRGNVQAAESPRRCYCRNAHYHKVAGAPLWICSTCHPPAPGTQVVDRTKLGEEGDRS